MEEWPIIDWISFGCALLAMASATTVWRRSCQQIGAPYRIACLPPRLRREAGQVRRVAAGVHEHEAVRTRPGALDELALEHLDEKRGDTDGAFAGVGLGLVGALEAGPHLDDLLVHGDGLAQQVDVTPT